MISSRSMVKGPLKMKLDRYKLPPNIMAALMTNRPELLRSTQGLTISEQAEVLVLLADLIQDRAERADYATQTQAHMDELVRNIVGATAKLEAIWDATKKKRPVMTDPNDCRTNPNDYRTEVFWVYDELNSSPQRAVAFRVCDAEESGDRLCRE